MPQTTSIAGFLNAHRDAHLDVARIDDRRLRAWLADIDASGREGVRRAWLVGRALNAERDALDHGEVRAWEKAKAKVLGKTVRTLASYRYLAENLDNDKIAMSLRISHAEAGLAALLRAIRKAKKAQQGDPVRTPEEDVAAWRRRARRLLKAVPKGRMREVLLRDHLEDVQRMLGRG